MKETLVGRLTQKLTGSAIIGESLRSDRRVPYLDRERLQARRDQRVRNIVKHAARTVPYYRDLFARERLDVASFRTATDLDLLPLLDKEQVRREPERFLSETEAGRNALSFLTSGTSGTPIRIHHDRHSLLRNIAYGERERQPVNKVCGSFRPREMYVGYETSTFKKVTAFYEDNVLFPVKPRRRFVPLTEPIERVVEIANEIQPDVIVGYGGWLHQFFRTVAARELTLHRPTVVMYMGEALPFGGRAFIEEHFGARVMSRYNAVESFKIGFFCEEGDGFHVHDDICHVRIVNDRGQSVPAGEQGRIVVSNLINRASVLLNYPIGDVAALTDRVCACGRTFRLLSELEGRVEDMLLLPGDRFVHPRSVWQIFKEDHDVIQYQLTQVALQQFELTLVTLTHEAYAVALNRALPSLNTLLGGSAEIAATHSTEFIRAQAAKFRAVASRIPLRSFV